MISLDTEVTGVDHFHGAAPYLVTTCDTEGRQPYWEWDVNPLTREPQIPDGDVDEIRAAVDDADIIVGHNFKFDAHAKSTIGLEIPWEKVRDTFIAAHLLASNHPHNLTDVCVEYLGYDILPFEAAVKEATKQARTIVKSAFPEWRIAKEGDNMMPSVKGSSNRDDDKPWKADMWLCRALRKIDPKGEFTDPSWDTVCAEYANTDSAVTIALWQYMEKEIKRRELWAIYMERMKLVPIAYDMECRGVTVIGQNTGDMIVEYGQFVVEAEDTLVTIAADFGHDLQLAEGASINDNMRDFFYGGVTQSCPRCNYTKRVKHWAGEHVNGDVCPKCAGRKRAPVKWELAVSESKNLGLPVVYGKKGTPSLDAAAMTEYQATLDEGPALEFLRLLSKKRVRETSISYLEGYRRFWLPDTAPGYYRLHPNLNPAGTDHLRWASYNPNGQNISKKEYECEDCDGEGCEVCNGTGLDPSIHSIRTCFGPAPGREWWSVDFENIELRIPAYESGEPAMVELFEKPNDPPYFGSYHLLVASILYPDEFWPVAEKKGAFKKKYKATVYQWIKNYDFAEQYGCGERKGDATARKRGAWRKTREKLPRRTTLAAKYLQMAERLGYVETLPDKSVDPARGYPILASRTEDGRVSPTTPFNYHISGTACWVKNRALVRCSEKIREWNAEGWDGFISLEIHDEILFDMPRGSGVEPWRTNLPRVQELKRLMQKGGEDIGLPTPVSVDYHSNTWATGISPA